MRGFIFVAALAALALEGCGGSEPAAADNSAADANLATAAAPPAPSHNYDFREGSAYGYQAAISEDDRKAGTAATQVVMFKYLGQSDGVYTLESADQPGMRMTCGNPCQYIKVTAYGSVVDRLSFNPASLIGEAFEDAFNGQLQAPGAPPAPAATPPPGPDAAPAPAAPQNIAAAPAAEDSGL